MAYRRRRKRRVGRTCVRFKRVRMRGGRIVRRCARFRGRGKRPFNKGKKCIQRYPNGKCRSYGARPRIGRYRAVGPMRASGSFYSNVPHQAPAWTSVADDPYIWP
jgi:hypothetical protein